MGGFEMSYTLLALRINDREDKALEIQKTLTRHGCKIMTRLGLHDHGDSACSPCGTMVLQLCCSPDESRAVAADLTKIDGVKAKIVDFD
jgi:hypothetical protein